MLSNNDISYAFEGHINVS